MALQFIVQCIMLAGYCDASEWKMISISFNIDSTRGDIFER